MSGRVDSGDVLARFQPITPAEAALVVSRCAESGRDVHEVVDEVKGERCGPAAGWEQSFAEAQGVVEGDLGGSVAPEPEVTPEVEVDGADVLVEGDDDEVAAFVAGSTIAAIEDALESIDDTDARDLATVRVVDAEQARGVDARQTLITKLGGVV